MITIIEAKAFMSGVFDAANSKPTSFGDAVTQVDAYIAANELDAEALNFVQTTMSSLSEINPDPNKTY